MSRYLLSPAAQLDIESIWDYTTDVWGSGQAEVYVRELQRTIEQLAANPRIGKSCDEIRPGYRKFSSGSHVVFYRVGDDARITVVRILHGRMDVDTNL